MKITKDKQKRIEEFCNHFIEEINKVDYRVDIDPYNLTFDFYFTKDFKNCNFDLYKNKFPELKDISGLKNLFEVFGVNENIFMSITNDVFNKRQLLRIEKLEEQIQLIKNNTDDYYLLSDKAYIIYCDCVKKRIRVDSSQYERVSKGIVHCDKCNKTVKLRDLTEAEELQTIPENVLRKCVKESLDNSRLCNSQYDDVVDEFYELLMDNIHMELGEYSLVTLLSEFGDYDENDKLEKLK